MKGPFVRGPCRTLIGCSSRMLTPVARHEKSNGCSFDLASWHLGTGWTSSTCRLRKLGFQYLPCLSGMWSVADIEAPLMNKCMRSSLRWPLFLDPSLFFEKGQRRRLGIPGIHCSHKTQPFKRLPLAAGLFCSAHLLKTSQLHARVGCQRGSFPARRHPSPVRPAAVALGRRCWHLYKYKRPFSF